MSDIQVKCTRCRHQCMKSDLHWVSQKNGLSIAVCPQCGGKSYYDMSPHTAWCWAGGLIEMGAPAEASIAVSRGAIPFATGPKSALVAKVTVAARHGKGASTGELLVPGVPEATDEEAAFAALEAFVAWHVKLDRRSKDVCWALNADSEDAI